MNKTIFKESNSIVFNDDCMNVMKLFPNHFFDLAIVDPPYGINASNMQIGSGKHIFTKKNWDNERPNKFYFDELFRVSKNQIIFGGNYFNDFLKPSEHWIIWDKLNPNMSFSEAEMAWMSFGKKIRIYKYYSANLKDGKKIHPTQKPIKLYEWIYKNFANSDHIILDTHLGSGSNRIAADKAGLKFVACEIDSEYYLDQENRFNNYKKQMTLF